VPTARRQVDEDHVEAGRVCVRGNKYRKKC
jgi:hypothetical protein